MACLLSSCEGPLSAWTWPSTPYAWGGLALAELREKLLFLWELHGSCVLRAGLRGMELGSRAVWSHGVLQQPEPAEATTVGAGATAGRAQLSEPA